MNEGRKTNKVKGGISMTGDADATNAPLCSTVTTTTINGEGGNQINKSYPIEFVV